MIEGPGKALRTRMMEHAELEYRRNGKHCDGDTMAGYIERFEKLSSVAAFEELLNQITQDAEA